MVKEMTNKHLGNRFEQTLCDEFSKMGFWVYNMVNKASGQPADVIAVKDQIAYLIDCKNCKNDMFSIERIEPNQHSSMVLWHECGNKSGWFALNTSKGIYLVSYYELLNTDKTVLNLNDIIEIGVHIDEMKES